MVYTHGDGSVTFGECLYQESYTTYSVRTISSVGITSSDIPKDINGRRTHGCYGAAGKDGTFYTLEQDAVGNYSDLKVVAIKNNVKLWESGYDTCGMGVHLGQPGWLTVGHDGDIYAVMSYQCNGQQTQNVLIGFDHLDGSIKFSPISLSPVSVSWPSYFHRLHVYAGGIVVLDSNTLRYFGYDGQPNGADYTFTLSSSEEIIANASSASGRVFVAVQGGQSQGCGGLQRVDYRDPNGTSGGISVSTACLNLNTMRAMHDGSVLLQTSGPNVKLVRYAQDGSQIYQLPLSSISGFWDIWYAWPQVDGNGNVVLVRSAVKQTGDLDRHTFVDIVDSTGIKNRLFDTLFLDDPTIKEVFRYTGGEQLGMTSDSLFCRYVTTPVQRLIQCKFIRLTFLVLALIIHVRRYLQHSNLKNKSLHSVILTRRVMRTVPTFHRAIQVVVTAVRRRIRSCSIKMRVCPGT